MRLNPRLRRNLWPVEGGGLLGWWADFPDGSFAELKQAIHEKLFTLPDDTIILPGHGPPTTVGEEKRNNPFVGLEESR